MNGSGGLDVSDTSRRSSSARAKSKRRPSIFTRRPSSRKQLKHNSSPEDRHAALDDEEGRFLFICYCVCICGERGGDKERVIGRGMGRLGLVALHIICSFLQHSLSNCNYTTQVMLNSG